MASEVLLRLQAVGVEVSLGGLGTTGSSLGALRSFPFDVIKCDRSFVADVADHKAGAIVRTIAGLGERLGMGVVAEGVETSEQFEIVRR